MRLVIASDHAGVELKDQLVERAINLGHEVDDLGTKTTASVDYPDYAHVVAGKITDHTADFGVLVCGTGIGMAMAANRHRGVRAAQCHDAFTAEMARTHNDANVLCLGARVTGPGVALQILDVFLSTPFAGDRHQRRVAKIEPQS